MEAFDWGFVAGASVVAIIWSLEMLARIMFDESELHHRVEGK